MNITRRFTLDQCLQLSMGILVDASSDVPKSDDPNSVEVSGLSIIEKVSALPIYYEGGPFYSIEDGYFFYIKKKKGTKNYFLCKINGKYEKVMLPSEAYYD